MGLVMTLRASRAPAAHAVAWGMVLAAVLVAGAAPVLVVPNSGLDTVYAERLTLPSRFEVAHTETAPALLDRPALGTEAAPAELTEAMAPAGTAVPRGHWTYTATVRERAADAVAAGNFTVTIVLDGTPRGTVVLGQAVANPLLAEGARVAFDLGPDPLLAPLLVLEVRPLLKPGEVPTLRSFMDSDLNYRWKGSGGDIEGVVNPGLEATMGAEFTVVAVNGDGTAAHNLRIKDADGDVVAGPTPDLVDLNDQATLAWTPTAPGTYTYECKYHATTQRGTIAVTA